MLDRLSSRAAIGMLVLASLLLSLLYASLMLHYTGGQWVLPLDDTYIYLQYGKNLAKGHFMQYNAGDPSTSGATSFLYPAVLAIGYLCGFRSDAALVFFAYLLNALFLCGSAICAFRLLATSFSTAIALSSSLFLLATGCVTWGFFVGMEIGLVVFLVLLAVMWLHEDIVVGKLKRSVAALALVAISRPEGLFFAVVVVLLVFLLARRRVIQIRGLWLLLVPMAGAVLYVAINYLIGGHFMPNSGRPKSPFYTPYFSFVFLLQHGTNFMLFVLKGLLVGTYTTNVLAPLNRIDDMTIFPPLSIVFFLVGLLFSLAGEWKRRIPGAGVFLGMWFVLGLLFVAVASGKGHHNFRYLLPFFAAYSLFIIPGIHVLSRILSAALHPISTRALTVTAGTLLLAFQLLTTMNFALQFGQGAYGFLPYKKIGIWAREHLPAGTRIAALDVGLIAYYSRLPVYDMFGLVTREMVESSFFYSDVMGSKFELLQKLPPEKRPRFFFVQKSRFEERGDEGHLAPFRSRLIYSIPSDAFATIGQDPSIYEIDWSMAGRAASIRDPQILSLLQGRRVVDELNVADLASHEQHNYRHIPPYPGAFAANRVITAETAGGVRIQEGAWGVLSAEAFDVRANSGKPLILVLRTNYIQNTLRVLVNGSESGIIAQQTPDPKRWYEVSLEIPSGLVRDRNRIEIHGRFMSAHYWFLQ